MIEHYHIEDNYVTDKTKKWVVISDIECSITAAIPKNIDFKMAVYKRLAMFVLFWTMYVWRLKGDTLCHML